MTRKIVYSFLFICIMLSCVNEYNPFKDLSNVKVFIDSYSFSEKDSVKLFSAETLNISLTLKEHIDSFSLYAPGNRLWSDTTLYKTNGLNNDYSFILSFKDTGTTEISLFLFRDNGTGYSDDISCRVYSPLFQDTIIGTFDDSIDLSTPAVHDRVKYHWDFGKGPIYWSYTPQLKCLVTHAADDSTGWLWVSDDLETHSSPKTRFTFVLTDTLGPRINCVNNGVIPSTDTVKTGDEIFAFKLYITDRVSDPVKAANIDSSEFNYVDVKSNIYTHIIDSMKNYTSLSPKSVTVQAVDYEENDSKRTFLLYFDENIDPTPKTILFVNSVNADTIFTATTLYSLFGEVINIEQQPITLNLFLNGQPDSSVKTFNNGNGEWLWQVTLEQDTINPISIVATDSNGTVQTAEHLAIYHDSHLADTSKPKIVFVAVEGMNPVTFITADITPKVSVTVYDNMSYVNSVTIAGSSASDSLALIWSDTITLLHGKNYIDIICTDSAGNTADTTITVYHNTLPFLTGGLSFPHYIEKGSTYRDTLEPYDFDNDTVSISIVSPSPPGLSISNQTNILTWQTDSVPLGNDTIKLKLYDGYQDTILQWDFEVIDSLEIFLPVRFKTAIDDFPKYLIAGNSQLSCTLSVADTTGKKPFTFYTYIQDLDTTLLNNASDSSFQWEPGIADTGYHQLVITVTDAQNTSDTLLPAIIVVPENQHTCSLSVVSLDTAVQIDYSTNTLDLTGVTDTLYLAYTIHDQDHPITEHYHVTKKIGNLSQTFDPDSTSFTIAVIPKPKAPNDTLFVTVVDKTGEPDTVEIIILHPAAVSPTEIDSLFYWFDATDSTTVLNEHATSCVHNQEVFQWINSPYKNDTLYHTTSHPRYYNTAEFSAVHFNKNANNTLFRNNPVDWANNPYTLFSVAQLNVKDDNKHYCIVSSTEKDMQSFSVGVTGGSVGILYKKRHPLDSMHIHSTTLTVKQNTLYLFSYMKQEIDADSLIVFLDGKQDVINTTGINSIQRNKTFVGTNFANQSDDGWDGDIAEIVIYNRALNPIERHYVEQYLAYKYGIKLNK